MLKSMQQHFICEKYYAQKQDPSTLTGGAKIIFQQLPKRNRKARFFQS
jgi:hypothetical protein